MRYSPLFETNYDVVKPRWNNFVILLRCFQVFTFDITHPEVAQLTLRVLDGSVFVAYTSVPLSCLRPGLRTLSLYDSRGSRKGEVEYSSLCLRIDFEALKEE